MQPRSLIRLDEIAARNRRTAALATADLARFTIY
jgi:hypothetical protein